MSNDSKSLLLMVFWHPCCWANILQPCYFIPGSTLENYWIGSQVHCPLDHGLGIANDIMLQYWGLWVNLLLNFSNEFNDVAAACKGTHYVTYSANEGTSYSVEVSHFNLSRINDNLYSRVIITWNNTVFNVSSIICYCKKW